MGKTVYPDTNNQFAYKTDRIGFLRRIKDRADTLWQDGYRALVDPEAKPHVFLVWKETEGLAAGHKVNAAEGVCTCKFFTEQYQFPLDPDDPGKYIPCKHLKGLRKLVAEEIAYFQSLESQARSHPYNERSRDRAESYCFQWNTLDRAWGQAMGAWYTKNRRAA